MSTRSPSTLEDRLRAVEDHLEILNLLAGSPFSSDIPSASFWEAMYGERAVMDRGDGLEQIVGRDAVISILHSPEHTAAVASGMAHVAAPPHIRIDADRAVATGYLQIIVPNPVGPEVGLGQYPPARGLLVWRLTANRWELERTDQGWRVTKRSIRAVPTPDASTLLHRGIDTSD
jgi:hypothetical protein